MSSPGSKALRKRRRASERWLVIGKLIRPNVEPTSLRELTSIRMFRPMIARVRVIDSYPYGDVDHLALIRERQGAFGPLEVSVSALHLRREDAERHAAMNALSEGCL